MESWTLVVAVASALAGIAAAVVAIVQAAAATRDRRDAEDARNESRAARDESVRLLAEANSELKGQREALERANEIELSKMPKPHVKWEIQRGNEVIGPALVNAGNIEAHDVVATGLNGIHLAEWNDTMIAPGGYLTYFLAPTYDDIGGPRLRVVWTDEAHDDRQIFDQTVL